MVCGEHTHGHWIAPKQRIVMVPVSASNMTTNMRENLRYLRDLSK